MIPTFEFVSTERSLKLKGRSIQPKERKISDTIHRRSENMERKVVEKVLY